MQNSSPRFRRNASAVRAVTVVIADNTEMVAVVNPLPGAVPAFGPNGLGRRLLCWPVQVTFFTSLPDYPARPAMVLWHSPAAHQRKHAWPVR